MLSGPVIADFVGASPTLMVSVLLSEQMPLVIFHCNTFTPLLKPLALVAANVSLVKAVVPLIKDQVPEPTKGTFAVRVVVSAVIN